MKAVNLLMIVAIIAMTLAVVNLIVHFEDIKSLTGFATDTGTANLTIISQASVSFITNNINWGTGVVSEAYAVALINSENTVTNGNWTQVNQALVLQNDGNSNVSVTLNTSEAASFIGGTGSTYELKVSDNETNSCDTEHNKMTAYTNTTAAQQDACTNLSYYDALDTIKINVQLRIPEDATPGAKGAVITATATPL
ncbi:hypothetical protein KAT80_02475 [Candidatus Pacearchaeota archaeon]|nr:hypothetical protein [Candidatus Pacearchaeota archaeon]